MKPLYTRRIIVRLLILLFSVLGLSISAQEITDPIDYINGMVLGNGFDYHKSAIYPRSPLVSKSPIRSPYSGQNAPTRIIWITDYQSLEKELEINFNSSIDVGFASASVKAYFYNKVHFEKNTIYLLVKSEILNTYEYVNETQLNAEAKNLLSTANGFDDFGRSYGNTFVFGIQSGGAYYGLITIVTTTEDERTNIEAQIKASYTLGTTNLDTKFQELTSNNRMELRMEDRTIGGTNLGYPPKSVTEMFDKANKLANQVSVSPVPMKAIVVPYTVFPEYSSAGEGLGIDRQLALLQLNYNYLDYINLKKKLDYIIQNPEFFRFKPNDKINKVNEFTTKIRDIEANLLKIRNARALVSDLSKPFPPPYPEAPNLFASKIMLPESYLATVRKLDETKPIGNQSINPLSKRTRGDDEMGGHSPYITLRATLLPSPQKLSTVVNINIYCQIRESVSDWTTFEDNKTVQWVREGFEFPKGLVIKSLSPWQGQLNAQAPEDQRDPQNFEPNVPGLIKSAMCLTDAAGGGETNKIGCKDVVFNPVTIAYDHREDAENRPVYYTRASELKIQIFKPRFIPNLKQIKTIDINKLKLKSVIKLNN